MQDSEIAVGIPGFVSFKLGPADLASLTKRFTRRPLLDGPCLIIERRSGLALDSTTDPRPDPDSQTRPVLWTVNGMPWQQWRIESDRSGVSRIRSQHSGLVLTTDNPPQDRSWVWLSEDRRGRNQSWNIRPTIDKTAFLIEATSSPHSLDATEDPSVPASVDERWVASPSSPILYQTHWQEQQQWVIARLPFDDS